MNVHFELTRAEYYENIDIFTAPSGFALEHIRRRNGMEWSSLKIGYTLKEIKFLEHSIVIIAEQNPVDLMVSGESKYNPYAPGFGKK